MQLAILAVAVFAAGAILGWLAGRGGKSVEGELRSQIAAGQEQLKALQGELNIARAAKEVAETRAQQIEKNLLEQKQLLDDARSKLGESFRSLASEILDQKTRSINDDNREKLRLLLDPLKDRLASFQKKVEDVYGQDRVDRTTLLDEVKNLEKLNQQLSLDASNLTRALTGSVKAQGAWGEMILERVLESAGLRKGYEYEVQTRYRNEDGSGAQPDVVLKMPEQRNLVIDSKVSLTAYEEHTNATTDEARSDALSRHLVSVRAHIKGLSERNYQSIYDLPSLDFVVMFVPIESAYMLALANDSSLWQESMKKHVLMVGPSTLLFVVRVVANLWRQESQRQNSQEIARRGANLYDKLSAFVADLEAVGTRLGQAQQSYDEAFRKLASGRGNVIQQAEKLKDLGIAPTKPLQQHLLDQALDEKALPGATDAAATGE